MAEGETAQTTWLAQEERGTVLGIRFVLGLCNLAGRSVARGFVSVLAFYYFAFSGAARRASRLWLSTAFGRPAKLHEVFAHLRTFALVTLDRIFLLQGKRELFEFGSSGNEHVAALTEQKRGAVLLGSHLGSFEALRVRGADRGHDIHVLAYFENAKKLSSVLAALAPDFQERVIPLGTLESLLRAKEVVESGALVAMLGDRVGLNSKNTRVQFMGREAPMPTGPFLLAATLGCPVLLVFAIYRGGKRYDLICEPFADRIVLPRKDREAKLRDYTQAYAARLEHYARTYPYNWFNLYDFWNP